MGVNLYGNINGKPYTPPSVNLFETAKNQRRETSTVTVSSLKTDHEAYKVDISEEGRKALHGSKLPGSSDPFETAAQIAYMSEHQPIESFSNRFAQMVPKDYTISESGETEYVPHSMAEKEAALVDGFKALYDEVSKGYDEGTRVRYIEDSTSEDGYRKLTKEEELSILKMEFDDFVEGRFGDERKAQNEAVKESLRELQELLHRLGKETKGPNVDKTEPIPEGFAEKIKETTTNYAAIRGMKIDFMQSFISNLKDTLPPMGISLR